MKVSKNQLKQIVKECLLEILSEGMGNINNMGASSTTPSSRVVPLASRSNSMPTNSVNENTRRQPNSALTAAVNEVAGGDRLMASIFEETARTTLTRQAQAERNGYAREAHADLASEVASEATPEQMFGEDVSSKWAELAFSSPVKKL